MAALTDPSRPFSPSVADEDASRINDDEMARLNVEISAAVAWWFHLKGSDNQRYRSLVQRALACLPLGRKTVRRSSEGEALRGLRFDLFGLYPVQPVEQFLSQRFSWLLVPTAATTTLSATLPGIG